MSTHNEHFRIAATHPVLPGHFPDEPIVPGVILLDRVVAAVERVWGLRTYGLPQVKFLRPLRPDQVAALSIERDQASARFRIHAGGDLIASGVMELAP